MSYDNTIETLTVYKVWYVTLVDLLEKEFGYRVNFLDGIPGNDHYQFYDDVSPENFDDDSEELLLKLKNKKDFSIWHLPDLMRILMQRRLLEPGNWLVHISW